MGKIVQLFNNNKKLIKQWYTHKTNAEIKNDVAVRSKNVGVKYNYLIFSNIH